MKSRRIKSAPTSPSPPAKLPLQQPPVSVLSTATESLLQSAMAHHQAGQLPQAETLYRQILQRDPEHAGALRLLAAMACQVEKYAMALELIDRAILFKPYFAEAYDTRGSTLHALGQYQAAVDSYDQAILLKPDFAQAYSNRGNPLLRLEQYQAALDSYNKAILLSPNFAQAYRNRGTALLGLQHYQAALVSYDKAILLKPDFAEAYCDRGTALLGLQHYQAAVESYDQAILLKPSFAEAYSNRGSALRELRQYQAAIESCEHAILLQPDYAEAYSNRGSALVGLLRHQDALKSFDQAILLNPRLAEAHKNRANVLCKLQQFQSAVQSFNHAILLKPDCAQAYGDRGTALLGLLQYPAALESYDKAILLQPNYAEAYSNRGSALHGLQRYQAAGESCEHAILLKPDYAEAHNNLGSALFALQQYQDALNSFDQAILFKPDLAEGYKNRGNALCELKQYQSALESFHHAILLKPDYEYLPGTQLNLKQILCDWEDIEKQTLILQAGVNRNERVAFPFELLAITSSAALQRKAAEIYVRDKYPRSSNATAIPRPPKHGKIRVGYFSADFYEHPVSYLLAELFERHDRGKFEILGFSFGPDKEDKVRARVSAAMDRFLDVRSLSDRDVAQLGRELEVDIAVDLMGFTKHSRMGIFAERAAPVQVTYLGYPGTTGSDYMDYLIADHTLIPQSSQPHYSEKIAYLPDSFQANSSQQAISQKPCSRGEQGLPESGFVYCCFNSSYKILPPTFETWMRILARVEGSVLWLLGDHPSVCANLRAEAERRNISSARLIFARRLPLDEHIARQRLADLFLDTYPFNAGATASPALWAGLPVLTCLGETLAGRMGASLLHAIDLPELVATTEAEYESLAVEIALDSERLKTIKQRLHRNRLTAPLFDSPRFTRHLEAAYTAMYGRSQANLRPDHLNIARCPK